MTDEEHNYPPPEPRYAEYDGYLDDLIMNKFIEELKDAEAELANFAKVDRAPDK